MKTFTAHNSACQRSILKTLMAGEILLTSFGKKNAKNGKGSAQNKKETR